MDVLQWSVAICAAYILSRRVITHAGDNSPVTKSLGCQLQSLEVPMPVDSAAKDRGAVYLSEYLRK